MDLIRKMSGLRSSQELSSTVVADAKDANPEEEWDESSDREEDEEEEEVSNGDAEQDNGDAKQDNGDAEPDDGDVFEDAAATPAPPQRDQQRQADDEEEEEAENGEEKEAKPVSPIRVRAPVSDDAEELDSGGEREEEEGGAASFGSGESFDSALERMASSSATSYETGTSPRISSPVGSPNEPTVIGSPPSEMSVSQQGALMRLNSMLRGDPSLDTSILDNNNTDQFKDRLAELAGSRGQSLDDASFDSIMDALLPLVSEKQRDENSTEADDANNAELSGGEDNDENAGEDDNENEEEHDGTVENGEANNHADDEAIGEQKAKVSSAPEQSPESLVNSVPDSNGGNHDEDVSEEDAALEYGSGEDADLAPTENGDHNEDEWKKESLQANGDHNDGETANDDIDDTSKVSSEDELVLAPGDREEYEEEENSEEEESEEDEDDGNEILERSAALDALVRAAESAAGGGGSEVPPMGSAGPSLPARPVRPPGRSSLPSLEPASRVAATRSVAAARVPHLIDDSEANGEPDGNEETREKLEAIRVKFLRLALRLGQSAQNVVVAQVLYRLGLAEQLKGGRSHSRGGGAMSFDRASATAEEQEAAGPEELDFACTIMLLGKTGVGKSATINSIFDEQKTGTNAFKPSTKKVQVITGLVHGIKVRVIDTPGLLPSLADQRHNEKVMASVKGFIKKQAPDIVLYFDRLDLQSRDYGDLPLLRTITDTFGAAVWFNAIVVLTHASSAPPDGPNGHPLSYEMFVAQRSHVVQQTIRQAAGDMRLMNPVSLVENHVACRVNRNRDRVLPNGQVWKPQLLLLCFASKILAEANSLLKLQDNTPGRPFGQRPRVPPLPFLLSSLLQSRAQLKMPDEQMGEEDESDEDLEDDESSSDDEDYDQLPPFRRLAKEEVGELDEETRANYFEELAERERLFQKKQWKEELKRRRGLKKRMAEAFNEESQLAEEQEDEQARSSAVAVPMPDMALPLSFDSDSHSHRYRYLETANQWIVRPVLESHGFDHDNGYDGMSLEKMFVVRDSFPASVSGSITKDKKDASLNMECATSLKHGEGKVTLAGLDIQSVAKDFAYTLRSETRFSNFKGNKTTGGLALTVLGDTVSAGLKIEDRLVIGKRVKLVMNGGAITGRGDVAYGGSLEASLRDKDYPLSRTLSTLGVSVMDWHGDLAIGGNLQSQMIVGGKTMMVGRANLNNRGAGNISIRASSSEQTQMALIGLLPIFRSLINRIFFSHSEV